MGGACLIVVLHVVKAGKGTLDAEVVAMVSGLADGRTGRVTQQIGLAVLLEGSAVVQQAAEACVVLLTLTVSSLKWLNFSTTWGMKPGSVILNRVTRWTGAMSSEVHRDEVGRVDGNEKVRANREQPLKALVHP